MDSATPIWALVLAFFCPPLIYTDLITFRSVPGARLAGGGIGLGRVISLSFLLNSGRFPRGLSSASSNHVHSFPPPARGHVAGGELSGDSIQCLCSLARALGAGPSGVIPLLPACLWVSEFGSLWRTPLLSSLRPLFLTLGIPPCQEVR